MTDKDFRANLICGNNIPIIECQLIAHQPSIKEIALIGETDFFIGLQTLCLHKTMFVEDKSLLETINNFQIFMTIMSNAEAKDKKEDANEVLKLIFPQYKILFTPNSILFILDGDNIVIDESNFEIFQEYLRMIFCMKDGPMDQQTFNPGNDKAREIAKKLMRGRERVAAQKGTANISVFSQYISILTVGLNSMTMQDLINLTVYQLYDLMERYSLYVHWDLDIRSRLAGAKPEDTVDNWMKNIH